VACPAPPEKYPSDAHDWRAAEQDLTGWPTRSGRFGLSRLVLSRFSLSRFGLDDSIKPFQSGLFQSRVEMARASTFAARPAQR